MINSINLAYLKGFLEAASVSKDGLFLTAKQVGDLLSHVDAAITEAGATPDKVIPAIQPAQIPLPFPAVPFTPYQPMPGITPFYPVQPTITPLTPNDLPFQPQWPGISDEQKYRWGVTCETIGVGYSLMGDAACCRDPFELDVSAGSTTEFTPNPVVMEMFSVKSDEFNGKPTADKLVAIMSDKSRAQKLEERRARSDERTANYGRPEKGYARD